MHRRTIANLAVATIMAMVYAFVATGSTRAQDQPDTEKESAAELLGPLTRDEIESANPDWIQFQIDSKPDLEVADALVTALYGAEVTVFMGTWCSDSRRELSRLWRALDDLGVAETPQISYIGVDRSKSEPHEYVDGVDLRLVPTFVVRRDGEEIGRIVEQPPEDIETDLLAVLRGEKTGTLSTNDEAFGEIQVED